MEEKGRKEMLLSSFHPAFKRRRNHLNFSWLKPNGVVSGVRKWDNVENMSGASRNSSGLDENTRSLDNETNLQTSDKQDHQSLSSQGLVNSNGLGDSLVIPKKPRATTRRKKIDILNCLKRSTGNSTSNGKTRTDAPSSKAPISIFPSLHSLNGDHKKLLDDKHSSCFSRDGSVPKIKDEKEKQSRKVQPRKRRRFEVEKKIHVEKEKLTDDEKLSGAPVEDDEDNLEQNAARMLSSRFDPSCTGFSGKKIAWSLKSAKGRSPLKQFNDTFKGLSSETSSVSAAGRVLRPRNRNSKGFARKRRHFYEVCSKDMDPNSLIKQRIRVFWPLDQCWYFGLVKDYDPASKLHHVKYDDRDEEWIDLQNERFKLLLFPSEVSRSLNSHNLGLELQQKTNQKDKDIIDDNCIGSFMETEPIISWLARSSSSLRSSPERVFKKRKAQFLNNFRPSTLSRKMNMNTEPASIRVPKSNSSSVVPESSLLNGEIASESLLNCITHSGERQLSFVYTRRRFRKRSGVLHDMPSQVSSCSSSAGSFHILASVTASVTALEHCGLTITDIGKKQISLKLLLLPQCVHDLSSALRICWLSHADYGLHYGKLIQVSPMVHMEIIFVDNVLGLRVVSFEGCFQWVWGFISLIISAFHDHKHKKLADLLLPSTSIGFNVSGFHDQRRQIVFALHSFLQLDKSRWEYLEYKLKHHCLKIMGLPVDSCLNSNLNNLPSSCEMLSTTAMGDPASDEDLPGRLCSSMNLLLNFSPQKNQKLPPYAFSFAESPYLFLGFHLKLLIQRNMTSLKLMSPSAMASKELAEIDVKSIDDGCLPIGNSLDRGPEMMLDNLGCSLPASSSGWLDDSQPKGEFDASSVSSDGDQMKTNYRSVSSEGKITGISMDHSDLRNECNEKIEKIQMLSSPWMGDKKYSSSSPDNDFPPEKHENGCDSCLNATSLHAQSYDQVKEQSNEDMQVACHASDLAWEVNALPVNVSKATGPRSIWHRPNSISPSSCQRSRLWTEDFIWDSFASGSRKPRTQVSYSLSFGNREIGSRPRSHNRKARPFKKIRIDNEKSMPHALGSFHTYFASRICDANVLVTSGDRGWRECGAQVVLDSDDQKGCRISVKFSGVTKYDHKVQQSLQPGSTNRFTHAMMWKGGKDWTLEFTDRNQWALFKELHEECYNRNIRSASVKNIPTPGVRLIEDAYEGSSEVPFVRSSPKYFRQVGTEIDMALDPSCVLYDMDSEDEEWISEFRLSVDDVGNNGSADVTDDVFEGIMDMFEKFAYAHECDEFTNDEIEEFMADGGPLNITKAIYEHWRHKRQKKGSPLIRQFQPPLWERYQQQLKQWESAMSKMHNPSDGSQDKGCLIEKPAMFAFCLRPRGLEVPNKFSKQRSHKKFIYSGHHNSFAKELDGLHAFDRKLNGTSAGGEKDLAIAIPTYESSDSFHSRHASSSFSPIDSRRMGFLMTNDASDRSHFPVLYRNNSKKIGLLASPRDLQMLPSHNQKVKRNSASRWSADMPEWPIRMDSHLDESHRHRTDIDEFRLRDASSAAQHARNMAKLKREKSHRLLHKANLALHKATVALITAEAIKASQKDLIGDG